jgi:hypothetical protein
VSGLPAANKAASTVFLSMGSVFIAAKMRCGSTANGSRNTGKLALYLVCRVLHLAENSEKLYCSGYT